MGAFIRAHEAREPMIAQATENVKWIVIDNMVRMITFRFDVAHGESSNEQRGAHIYEWKYHLWSSTGTFRLNHSLFRRECGMQNSIRTLRRGSSSS